MANTYDLVIQYLRACGPCSRDAIRQEILTQDVNACQDDYKQIADNAIEYLTDYGIIKPDSDDASVFEMIYRENSKPAQLPRSEMRSY